MMGRESCARSLTFDSALEAAIGRTGVLPPVELADARRQSDSANLGLREVLVASGRLAEDQVNFLVAEELRIESVHLSREMVDPSLVLLFPPETLQRACAIPLLRDGDTIVVAMADPTDDEAIGSLASHIHQRIRPVIGRAKEILDALTEIWDREAPEGSRGVLSGGRDTKSNDPSGVVFLYHHLERANREKAKEIHIEPGETGVRVRYRIGPGLKDVETQPRSFLFQIMSRVRILAGLPQDKPGRGQTGAIRARVGAEERIIGIAIAPTPFGETAVIRLQPARAAPPLLGSWDFAAADGDAIRQAISERAGLVLLCSTDPLLRKNLAYSLLMDIDSERRKICTLERGGVYPVERFQQVCDPTLGAESIEMVLGLSPDVLFLEDVWNVRPAAPALQASLSRLLLVTTVPYSATLEALVHLADLSVPHPFLGRALQMAVAVRRHRRLCEKCRVILDGDSPSPAGAQPSCHGCPACEYTGYKGHVIACETLFPSALTRGLLSGAAPWRELAEALLREGWTGMEGHEESLMAKGVLPKVEA